MRLYHVMVKGYYMYMLYHVMSLGEVIIYKVIARYVFR